MGTIPWDKMGAGAGKRFADDQKGFTESKMGGNPWAGMTGTSKKSPSRSSQANAVDDSARSQQSSWQKGNRRGWSNDEYWPLPKRHESDQWQSRKAAEGGAGAKSVDVSAYSQQRSWQNRNHQGWSNDEYLQKRHESDQWRSHNAAEGGAGANAVDVPAYSQQGSWQEGNPQDWSNDECWPLRKRHGSDQWRSDNAAKGGGLTSELLMQHTNCTEAGHEHSRTSAPWTASLGLSYHSAPQWLAQD